MLLANKTWHHQQDTQKDKSHHKGDRQQEPLTAEENHNRLERDGVEQGPAVS